MKTGGLLARMAYGAAFVVVLPVALVLWARATQDLVHLPAYRLPRIGGVLLLGGLALVIGGMRQLFVHGGGLPMNAFPPRCLVSSGVYRLLAHPIYVGSVTACGGGALLAGSASGLWLVTPALALACAALVLGHERPDLLRRLGAPARPWLALPRPEDRPATCGERLAALLLVHGAWLAAYEGVLALGLPAGALDPWLAWERGAPTWAATAPIYASIYPVVLVTPLLPRTARAVRDLSVTALVAFALSAWIYLWLPVVAAPRPMADTGLAARLLLLDRSLDSPAGALPSLHAVWALLGRQAISSRWPRARGLATAWAVAVIASCWTTGQHALLDLLAGLAVYVAAAGRARIWKELLALSERVANSWREWRLGPVRLISHAGWAALAAGGGLLMAQALAGTRLGEFALLAVAGLLAAALWAQLVEGSPALLRPFGYYGSLVGLALGGAALAATGRDPWPALGALAAAAPWIQAVGRLRCLVQGCCHGRPCASPAGLRYRHPMSRVVRLTSWRDVPLHATPLYSILANIAAGTLLLRLWNLGMPLTFVTGAYMFLNGASRFVEESFRGEPQTPHVLGLPLYQWNAVIALLTGAALTAWPGAPALPPSWPGLQAALLAVTVGLVTGAAMGVDLPAGQRRFSRLA